MWITTLLLIYGAVGKTQTFQQIKRPWLTVCGLNWDPALSNIERPVWNSFS